MKFLRYYRVDLAVLLVLATYFFYVGGVISGAQFITLVILEVALSFDNAIVNALILKRLSHGWQKAFIYVGIWIAVFGMRFVFPVLIVSLTAGLGFGEVISLAWNDPTTYSHHLELAHPEIATLGGVYLGMIFLNFFLSDENEFRWIKPVENLLAKIGKADTLSAAIMAVVILVISQNIGGEEGGKILLSGLIALALYLVVQAVSSMFEDHDEETDGGAKSIKYGFAGVGLFLYLEVQDAAFSFDGVSGAFAITSSVVMIAAGLGVGALFVRSMTVHLVETGKLDEFPYLASGAHWAIGGLAACILTSLYVDVPEWVTGPIGAVFIIASVISSVRYTRAQKREQLASAA